MHTHSSNSSQVSGSGQLQQAIKLTFKDGMLAPFRVVGPASFVAWFLQYSVMGFVFQSCDNVLSSAMGVPKVVYGDAIFEPGEPLTAVSFLRLSMTQLCLSILNISCPAWSAGTFTVEKSETPVPVTDSLKSVAKAVAAPMTAGAIESMVSNRAEVQRFYGIKEFAKIEGKLGWSAVSRNLGPAFVANSSRNFVMSTTSFVLTPILYKNFFPQEKKSQSTFFWFGLGFNIFGGNVVGITQQALWGRALDYGGVDGGRNINYRAVISEGLKKEGPSAFFTPAKWFARVLMNAPAQGETTTCHAVTETARLITVTQPACHSIAAAGPLWQLLNAIAPYCRYDSMVLQPGATDWRACGHERDSISLLLCKKLKPGLRRLVTKLW